jgi:hypothetical protein
MFKLELKTNKKNFVCRALPLTLKSLNRGIQIDSFKPENLLFEKMEPYVWSEWRN